MNDPQPDLRSASLDAREGIGHSYACEVVVSVDIFGVARTVKTRLSFAADDQSRLVITPVGLRRCVSLRLGESSAEVIYGEHDPVALPWDALGNIRWVMDGPALDGWVVTHFTAGRGGVMGVAVRVSGCFDSASHDLALATRRRFSMSDQGILTGHALAMLPTGTTFSACARERATLIALTTVLSRRPDLRTSLSVPTRISRLAQDLTVGLVPFPVAQTGTRRDTVDIIVAMHAAGFVHRFGRPLGDQTLPSLADAVAQTRTRLNASPYRKGRITNDATIASVIQRTYLDIKPWPFGALVA